MDWFVSLSVAFSWLLVVVGGPSPVWTVQSLSGGPGRYKKGNWTWEPGSKPGRAFHYGLCLCFCLSSCPDFSLSDPLGSGRCKPNKPFPPLFVFGNDVYLSSRNQTKAYGIWELEDSLPIWSTCPSWAQGLGLLCLPALSLFPTTTTTPTHTLSAHWISVSGVQKSLSSLWRRMS